MWDAITGAIGGVYDFASGLFGDDLIEEGIRAGYDYLTDDDQSSSGTKLKRLRGRVGIKTAGMAPPGATKAPGSRVSSQYEVVYLSLIHI